MTRSHQRPTKQAGNFCGPTRKVLYKSWQQALEALGEARTAREQGGDRSRRESRIYKCWYCGAFHLTSQPHRGRTPDHTPTKGAA